MTLLLAAGVFAVLLGLGHLAWPALADVLDVVGTVLLVAVVVATVLGPRREIEYVVHHAVVFTVLTAAGHRRVRRPGGRGVGRRVGAGRPAAVGLARRRADPGAAAGARSAAAVGHAGSCTASAATRTPRCRGSTASTERVEHDRAQAVTEVARLGGRVLRVPWAQVSAGDAHAEWGRRPLVADDVTVAALVRRRRDRAW